VAQKQQLDEAVARALAGARYILGPEVAAFEAEFAQFCGGGHALGVGNGTDALAIALRAAGVQPGQGVATVSHTAVATVVAVRSIGAVPLMVDVDDGEGTMDPAQLVRVLDEASTRGLEVAAVVPVHLYGRCADLPAISRITRERGLLLVEDCAQSHGAVLDGVPAGKWGQAASYSFYPTKNLGAFGDGGAVFSTDPELRERARLLREYGWRTRYVSDIEGGNSRLDELHAAMLRVKLGVLAAANARRQAIARIYRDGIRNPAVRMTPEPPAGAHVYHQFVLRCSDREALRAHLSARGIGTLVHYPVPVHLQPAYADPRFAPLPLPRTEAWAREVLSLPIFPELEPSDAARVVAAVNEWQPQGR
jgi:dTDP-4-amino-4,6-dideoxygalactose transaminase